MNIIVLDASATVREKIKKLILSYKFDDVDIHLFEDGGEALDFIEMHDDIDIVFSSIETKGIDGVSLVDLIQRKYPALLSKLFIVTSQTKGDVLEEIKDVGARRFIKKPINEEHFKHFVLPEMQKIITLDE